MAVRTFRNVVWKKPGSGRPPKWNLSLLVVVVAVVMLVTDAAPVAESQIDLYKEKKSII